MSNDLIKRERLSYYIMGAGALLAGVAFFKYSQAKAAANALNRVIPRYNKRATITPTTATELSNIKAEVPAVFFKYEEDTSKGTPNSLKLNAYKLNFTPRRFSTTHDETLNNDLGYLQNVFLIPKGFEKISNRSEMIHPNDYQILQLEGFIPEDFPLEQVVYSKSPNGKNEFLIGYSAPGEKYAIKGSGGNKPKVSIVKPLWALSFGKVFNTESKAPKGFHKEKDFLENAERILAAEGLSSRSNRGCDFKLNDFLCAAEKTAILSIFLRRYKLRKQKDKNFEYIDVVYKGGFPTWNPGCSFKSDFNAYLGQSNKCTKSDKRSVVNYPKKNRDFTKEYLEKYFWHLPNYGVTASHYIHPDATKSLAPFMEAAHQPFDSDKDKYSSKHKILVGRSIVLDRSTEFTGDVD